MQPSHSQYMTPPHPQISHSGPSDLHPQTLSTRPPHTCITPTPVHAHLWWPPLPHPAKFQLRPSHTLHIPAQACALVLRCLWIFISSLPVLSHKLHTSSIKHWPDTQSASIKCRLYKYTHDLKDDYRKETQRLHLQKQVTP